MRYILTGEQMRKADAYTIETMGIPSMVLMERAALSVVDVLFKEGIDLSRPLILCGSGNNGGDGLAIARLLFLKGFQPYVWYLGNPEHASEENERQCAILANYGVSVRNTLEEKEYSVIIDCIFGTGLKREIGGCYREAIERVNRLSATKIAVDIPSGVSDTAGDIWGVAFQADITVCLAYEKLGTVLYPGAGYAGRRIVTDIGIAENALPAERKFYTFEPEDLKTLLPVRKADSHKGSYGKVLMITGSKGMAGAAYLSAKAAYRMGAGLINIYTDEENRTILQQLLPEAIITTYTGFDEKRLKELFDWADVVAIGSGLGLSETAEKIFTFAMQYVKTPCIIDGDGITLLAEEMRLLEHKKQIILTPHLKEMSRLLQCTVEELKKNRLHLLEEFTEEYPVVCALKDARTIVAGGDGDWYVNETGNSAMAKGGSGDVLAGILAGLLAHGMQNKKACETAVFLHGLCGDYAKAKMGSYSVLAGELSDMLGEILKTDNNL